MERLLATLNSDMEYDGKTWGQRCKALIRERRMTQVEFAERLGVAQSTLNKWLNGRREPTLKELAWIARALTEARPDAPVFPGYMAFGLPSARELAAALAKAVDGLGSAAVIQLRKDASKHGAAKPAAKQPRRPGPHQKQG